MLKIRLYRQISVCKTNCFKAIYVVHEPKVGGFHVPSSSHIFLSVNKNPFERFLFMIRIPNTVKTAVAYKRERGILCYN